MFQDAKLGERYAKILMYGEMGVGKTPTALTLLDDGEDPDRRYFFIDLEGGSDLYRNTYAFTSPKEQITVPTFHRLPEFLRTHPPAKGGVVIVDPITVLWEMYQRYWIKKIKGDFDHHYQYNLIHKDWFKIKLSWKSEVINPLKAIPAHLFVIAREKPITDKKGNIIGATYDCEKDVDYSFDIICRLQKDGNVTIDRARGELKDLLGKKLLLIQFKKIIRNFYLSDEGKKLQQLEKFFQRPDWHTTMPKKEWPIPSEVWNYFQEQNKKLTLLHLADPHPLDFPDGNGPILRDTLLNTWRKEADFSSKREIAVKLLQTFPPSYFTQKTEEVVTA